MRAVCYLEPEYNNDTKRDYMAVIDEYGTVRNYSLYSKICLSRIQDQSFFRLSKPTTQPKILDEDAYVDRKSSGPRLRLMQGLLNNSW